MSGAPSATLIASPLQGAPQADVAERTSTSLFAIGLIGFCAFLGFHAGMPLLPLLQRVFGVSPAESALTQSAAIIGMALGSPFVGLLSRRFGYRRTLVAALLALPVPMLLAATAPSLPVLVAWRFLQGLVVPVTYTVTLSYLASEWPAEQLGRAMSSFVTGNILGGFGGRLVAGVAAQYLGGWRASFIALGVILALAGTIAVRILPVAGASHRPDAGPERARPRDVLGEPRLLATFVVGFMVAFSIAATFTYVTFHLAAPPFGLDTAALAYLFTTFLVGAVVTPFAGRWIDRAGSRRTITAALSLGIAGGALTLAPSLAVVVVGLTMISTAVVVSQAASTTYLRTAAPPRARRAAAGLYVSVYYVGGALGGVAPALAWNVGGWTACVALVATMQVTTLVIARRAWRPARC